VDGVTALGSQGEGLIQYTTDADVASNHRDRFNASEDTMLVSALRTVQATQVTAANSTRNTMQTNLRKRTQTNAALKGVDEEKRIAVYSFGLALDSYRSPYSSARLLLHELFHKFCGCGDYFYCNIWEYPYYSNMSNEVALDNADSYAWITVSLKARAVLTYKNVERATISSS
jgi:hypothetical protein